MNKPLKISQIIAQLQKAQKEFGDHPMSTYDGFITSLKFTPAKDGTCYPLERGTHNEISIDISTN